VRTTVACLLLAASAVLASCGGSASSIPPRGDGSSSGPVATLPRPSVFANLPLVQLVAPDMVGAGRAPTFEWSPVGTADAYRLSVLGPDGPMWAWQGETTSIRYGGVSDGTHARPSNNHRTSPSGDGAGDGDDVSLGPVGEPPQPERMPVITSSPMKRLKHLTGLLSTSMGWTSGSSRCCRSTNTPK